MRVLVVDDNKDLIGSVKLLLERYGHEVYGCTDATQCIPTQARHPADVLITDIFMPEFDGLQVIQQFRARWPDTAIIAISGGGAVVQQDYLVVARDLGADLALRKPFDPEVLVNAVADLPTRRQPEPHT